MTISNSQKMRLYQLTCLRGLAAFVVFLVHGYITFAQPIFGSSLVIEVLGQAAKLAVISFFLLSGYLIFFSLEKNVKSSGFFDLRHYAKSRLVRIYPPLVLSVGLVLLLAVASKQLHALGVVHFDLPSDLAEPVRHELSFSLNEVVGTLLPIYTFLSGRFAFLVSNGPLWSLSYEVGFYLFAGLAVASIKSRTISSKLLCAASLAALAFVARTHMVFLFPFYGLIWLLGGCTYFFDKIAFRAHTTFALVAILAPFFSLVLLWTYGSRQDLIGASAQVLAGLILIIGYMNLSPQVFSSSLVKIGKSLYNIGGYSYSLYLFHFPIQLFMFGIIHRSAEMFGRIAYVALALICSAGTLLICKKCGQWAEGRYFAGIVTKPFDSIVSCISPRRFAVNSK